MPDNEGRHPRSRPYDGGFYARYVDPFISGLHRVVAAQVEPGARVLDVGCGTGSLASRMAPSAREVVAIELSPAMAAYATRHTGAAYPNVSVVLGDVVDALASHPDGSFDVATMVLALHEMPAAARAHVLREVTRASARLVCLDYRVPMPWNLPGARNRLAELLAGAEHYRAFRDFTRRGGTAGICAEAALQHASIRFPDHGTFELSEIRAAPDGVEPRV